MITRHDILQALRSAMEPLDYVHAMWEGGAAAFDRVDEWSDIDLQFDVDDERVEDTFLAVDAALAALSPIDLRYRLPDPTWHGHSQVFYRMVDASPFLLLDLSVSKRSSTDKFLQREVHGNPVVHFDKSGVIVMKPLDVDGVVARRRGRVETMRITFEMFQPFVDKELNRGNSVEAVAFYHGSTLRPLVEALRIRYCPARSGFHTRYVQYDLPADAVTRLERLFYVTSPDDLRRGREDADRWFRETIEAIDFDEVGRLLKEESER